MNDVDKRSIHDSVRDLRRGDVRVVVGIRTDPALGKRLADIGFVPGTRVEMVRPGSPCIVRINGTGVGLGTAHQRAILLNRGSMPGIDASGVVTDPPESTPG